MQATTHFAAPLIVVNGPVRRELGFACGSNVFSNVARANSTLGRAFQLILTNIGGARPGELDMSTLGNPGKFSYCIAENEEENPWAPLHTEFGFDRGQSAVTLFAAEPPHGVSEHNAREGRAILKAVCRALATVFSYRFCSGMGGAGCALPRTREDDRSWRLYKRSHARVLFENTGIPIKEYEDQAAKGLVSYNFTSERDQWRRVLPEIRAAADQARSRGWNRGQIFGGDRELGVRLTRQPDGLLPGQLKNFDWIYPLRLTALSATQRIEWRI